MTEAPKRIWAWITGIQPLQGNAGLWRSDEGTLTDDEYILATEHERIVAEWRIRAEFAEAQLEGLLEMLPPPEPGSLMKRLRERAMGKRG